MVENEAAAPQLVFAQLAGIIDLGTHADVGVGGNGFGYARKIASLRIGAFLSGSSAPSAWKEAALPLRTSTAPGIVPLPISASKVSVRRCRRSVAKPTLAGSVLINGSASAAARPTQ